MNNIIIEQVKERDNHTCRICEKQTNELQVKFAEITGNGEFFDLANWISVCEWCIKTEKKWRKK